MIGPLFAFSIFVLSLSPIIIRFAQADAMVICFWRLLMACAILAPIVTWKKGWQPLRYLKRRDWAVIMASGLMLFIHFWLFFRAVQETSVANSTILLSLNPVFTAIGAWLVFRERPSPHLVLAALLGLLGVAVLFGGSLVVDVSHWQGDLYAILSGVTFSAYILTGKSVRTKLSNLPFAFLLYAQTAAYAFIAMWLLDLPFVGYDGGTWMAFLGLAVLPTLFGHAVFTYCLQFLNVNFMSCMTLTEPIIAALIASALFNEPLTTLAILGFTLTAASVLTLYAPALRSLLRRGTIRSRP